MGMVDNGALHTMRITDNGDERQWEIILKIIWNKIDNIDNTLVNAWWWMMDNNSHSHTMKKLFLLIFFPHQFDLDEMK